MTKKENKAIFVFTKESPQLLKLCLSQVAFNTSKIFVVDDSYSRINIFLNKDIIREFKKVIYLGSEENEEFYLEYNHKAVLKARLGIKKWNLGNARNFVIDFAITNGFEKILFLDDDILFKNLSDVENGFRILNDSNFVSYKITGMVDDSIVGHIASRINYFNSKIRMLSGGIIYLNPDFLNYRFTNIYNEDWIIQLLEFGKQKILLDIEVVHKSYNPFSNYKEKIIFQEYGEIFVRGLIEIYRKDLNIALTVDFWKRILQERICYINDLTNVVSKLKKVDFIEMLIWLKKNYNLYNEKYFYTLMHKIIQQKK